MWERTLQDLIRGLRANKKDEGKFIAQAVDEIRREVRSKDMELKAGAVLKLAYLDMLGHDMGWAAFHVVEVMSSPKYHLKAVGYLAATQSFGPDTDVLMLTTNLLKKDLTSTPLDTSASLNGLSHFITADLARDLSADLVTMLSHSRPAIRKRAVAAVYKMLVKYPQAAPYAQPRLREKLEDSDPGVVAATTNVLCELVRHNPTDYLSLAPQLFHLLTTSSNNWMLIKLIKMFGFLAPHEPRLARKLQPPLTELIATTPAISLLYECVHTSIVGGMLATAAGDALAESCVTKLAAFLGDADQNLKYIALLAMVKIVPTHAHLVARYQDVILASVDDQDVSIRMRALDLLTAMASPHNLQSIVQQLLAHLADAPAAQPTAAASLAAHLHGGAPDAAPAPSKSPAYRLVLAQRILAMCAADTYASVRDFGWLLSVLVDLAHVARAGLGPALRAALADVVARVRGVRAQAVGLMAGVLADGAAFMGADDADGGDVLAAAAWVCGEHCGALAEPQRLLPLLLAPGVAGLAPEAVGVHLGAVLKVFGLWAAELADAWDADSLPAVKAVVEETVAGLRPFSASADIEVQERAANALQLFAFVQADLAAYTPPPPAPPVPAEGFGAPDPDTDTPPSAPAYPKSLLLLRPLFDGYELGPVNPAAQAAVPPPADIDLDAWIVPPPAPPTPAPVAVEKKKAAKGKGKAKETNGKAPKRTARAAEVPPETAEERAARERAKAERLERQRDDPYYIPSAAPAHTPHDDDIDAIPVVRLDGLPPLPSSPAPAPTPAAAMLRTRVGAGDPYAAAPASYTVDRDGEMPAGFAPPPPPARPASTRPASSMSGSAALSSSVASLPPPPSRFPEYVVDEDEAPAAPVPIKVVRAKKGGAGDGAKKKKKKAAPAA